MKKSRKVRKKVKRKLLKVCLKYTKQDTVIRCVKPVVYDEHLPTKLSSGPIKQLKGSIPITESPNVKGSDIVWVDNLERLKDEERKLFKKKQSVNRFNDMKRLLSKNELFMYLNRFRYFYPDDFNFYPLTYLSNVSNGFNAYPGTSKKKKKNTKKTNDNLYIIKPSKGSMGEGIYLSYGIQERQIVELLNKRECVIQKYIPDPYLLDGCKTDLRLYVLVVSYNYPKELEVFIFNDGLVRLCTEKYGKPNSRNISKAFMHLTNYSLNKYSEKFEFNEDENEGNRGHKRTIQQSVEIKSIFENFEFQQKLNDLVLKVLISVQGEIKVQNHQNLKSRFHLLGFDILIDKNLNPYLLEVNQNPSLQCEHPLDEMIKQKLINQIIQMIGIYKFYGKKRKINNNNNSNIEKEEQEQEEIEGEMNNEDSGFSEKIRKLCPGFSKIPYYSYEYKKYNLFSSEKLIKLFRKYCSVRTKNTMTSSKFRHFFNDFFSRSSSSKNFINSDLLFTKIKNETGKSQLDYDSFIILMMDISEKIGNKEEHPLEKFCKVLRILECY